MTFLDFEKPVADLVEQLEKTKQFAEKNKSDVTAIVMELEKKLHETRRTLYSHLTPWQKVQLSRHPDRPYSLAYIDYITDKTFIEQFGDRHVKDDKAIVGGFGSIEGMTCMFIGQQKGNTT